MIETQTTKQIILEYEELRDNSKSKDEKWLNFINNGLPKVWVGLESLKELLKEMWEKDLIEVYAYEILQEELGLCNSQEQTKDDSKKSSLLLDNSSVSCEHNTGEDKPLDCLTLSSEKSSPVQNPKKCTCYDAKIEVDDDLNIINKCGRCGGEL